jgi:rhodanese-related sulfurtransferase
VEKGEASAPSITRLTPTPFSLHSPPLSLSQALHSDGGYYYLDVRPALELDEVGKYKGCVNISPYKSKRVFDAEANKKVVVREENPDFIAQVEKRFPDKETKLIVACSDGKSYSMDALGELDEAGYVNLVALKGGYYAWNRTWDNNLRRRRGDGYTENHTADGDSTGIFATGAGFQRSDKIENWVPPSY